MSDPLRRSLRLSALILVALTLAPGVSFASAQVPPEAPDSVPAWFFSDDGVRGGAACTTGRFVRGILAVKFHPEATHEQRQEAADRVDAEVVGGINRGVSEGYYYFHVGDDPEGEILCEALEALEALPYVAIAHPSYQVSPLTPG